MTQRIRRGRRFRNELYRIHLRIPPQHRYIIPRPRRIDKHLRTVNIPPDLALGNHDMFWLEVDRSDFCRYKRIFELTCPDLLGQGWHIHEHDILLQYNDVRYFKQSKTMIGMVYVYIRHFRADQLIMQLVITPP